MWSKSRCMLRPIVARPFPLLVIVLASLGIFLPSSAFAAGPWETIVTNVSTSISGPIARGLSLVAIVVGGLTWAFDEGGGGSKRMLAGILFGAGMAVCAAQFYLWLFGTS